MTRFEFSAVDRDGRERIGAFEAQDPAAAADRLRREGWYPTRLEPMANQAAGKLEPSALRVAYDAGARQSNGSALAAIPFWRRGWGRTVTSAQLAVFTRQLATLLSASLPLARALQVLERQQRNDTFRRTLRDVLLAVAAGRDFSVAIREHPRCFPAVYASVARAGEASGNLGAVLEQLAVLLEKSERLKSRVRAALCYPVVVAAVTVAIVAGLLVFVVPKFEVIFSDLLRGAPLPALTRAVLAVSEIAREHAVAGMVLVVIFGTLGVRFRTTRVWQRVQLVLPVLGVLVGKSAVARATRTLGTLLRGGVPVLQALKLARETVGNAVLEDVFRDAHDRVREGQSLSGTLAASRHFPAMAASMVEVGEETGELPGMLERVAETYDAEVEAAAAALTSVIEPALIVVLAAIVGTIVIALFLPIVRILQTLSG